MPTYHLQTPIGVSAETLFDWHSRPSAFNRLLPPWEDTQVIEHGEGLEVGVRTVLDMPLAGPARVKWVAEHTWCERPTGFDDVQQSGPFAAWTHKHRFADGLLTDTIEWLPPMGALGLAVAGGSLEARLDTAFRFRHARTKEDLERHATWPAPKTIAITGASGLVGTALTHFLQAGGHTVRPLVRRREDVERLNGIYWNVRDQEIDAEALEGIDAVVHLAGAGIAEGAWTDARKDVLRSSRIDGTRLLATALAALHKPPEVFVSGSAVGFYGDRGDEVLTEASPSGAGFLAELCREWEAATEPAQAAGIRTVHLRTGIVLAMGGGALPAMLPAFRMGGGGPIGGGAQYVPWIHLDDLVYAIHHAMRTPSLKGPVNGTSAAALPQRDFAGAIGAALHRPAFLPAPAMAIRMALGREKADELVLAGQNVHPQALEDSGFRFAHPAIEGALRSLLGT
jgi:uncharacterized protein